MESIKYQYLGYKTFLLFTLKRSKLFFIFLLLSLTFSLIGNNLNGNISLVFNKIALIGFWLTLTFLGIALLSAWLEYINYRFILDENAFKVRRGILRKEEIAIPYRQIQNVNIKRNFIDQVIGVSKLIILTAGREDKDEAIWTESEGVLPSVNKNLAQKIQDELLRRANVEQVVMK
jgi:putative membrane protein